MAYEDSKEQMVQLSCCTRKKLGQGIEIGRLQLDAPCLDLATGVPKKKKKLMAGLSVIEFRIFTWQGS